MIAQRGGGYYTLSRTAASPAVSCDSAQDLIDGYGEHCTHRELGAPLPSTVLDLGATPSYPGISSCLPPNNGDGSLNTDIR